MSLIVSFSVIILIKLYAFPLKTNILLISPSSAGATFVLSTRTKIFEKHLNTVMLAFIGTLA